MSAPKQLAKLAVFKGGKLLMGKRHDDKKWCCPGGHIEKGESPTAAAHRELEEETGLKAVGMLQSLGRKSAKGGAVIVHVFRADVDGEPKHEFDPDEEFSELRWLDPDEMPAEVMRNLHSEPDVVLESVGARGPAWASFGDEAEAA